MMKEKILHVENLQETHWKFCKKDFYEWNYDKQI